ncbi:Uncharacterised protein [Vibrio cholerae]|uniref:Uncharacterized protein n=1 Tax=Vibrio cholerae TaxID=666 RepID=A0A655XDM6_VIBCL|nr:Uncharacterised protein [Vibrio cholerae]CSD12009.1 Uncharacterised protein [Vibrio cholerae]CSD50436.1 Uncharacterised protein [Vibrio cholerae]
MHHADFIVHVHDRNQNSVITHRGFKLSQINQAIAFWIKISHFKAFTLQLAHGIQYRFVFGFAGDDVLALLVIEVSNTFDREVVRFSSTRSEHNFTWVCIQQGCDLLTRSVYRFFCLPAITVRARSWVTEGTIHRHVLNHFFSYARINRACR